MHFRFFCIPSNWVTLKLFKTFVTYVNNLKVGYLRISKDISTYVACSYMGIYAYSSSMRIHVCMYTTYVHNVERYIGKLYIHDRISLYCLQFCNKRNLFCLYLNQFSITTVKVEAMMLMEKVAWLNGILYCVVGVQNQWSKQVHKCLLLCTIMHTHSKMKCTIKNDGAPRTTILINYWFVVNRSNW